MAKPDEIWIPFGDETTHHASRGYWAGFADTSKQRVIDDLRRRCGDEHPGVKVIKVKLVPVPSVR